MSMNRLVGLGIFVLSSSLLATFAACDNSATTPAPSSAGGSSGDSSEAGGTSATSSSSTTSTTSTTNTNTAKGGASSGNSSSASSSGASKGGSSSGSSKPDSSPSTGGTSGGSSDTGTSTTPPSTSGCDATTDLIAAAKGSDTQNWIGGDPDLTDDNPCGVQGAIYVYSDKGLDKNENTGDESVKEPAYDPAGKKPADRVSACKDGKCCIKGATALWPKADGKTDYTAEVWGGGLGISLNANKDGEKSLYDGPMKGVILKTEITAPGDIRIKLTQGGTDSNAPFATIKTGGETKIYFADQTQADAKPVACPTAKAWGADNAYVLACKAAAGPPADIQVEIVGGDAAGDFELCILSVTPIL